MTNHSGLLLTTLPEDLPKDGFVVVNLYYQGHFITALRNQDQSLTEAPVKVWDSIVSYGRSSPEVHCMSRYLLCCIRRNG